MFNEYEEIINGRDPLIIEKQTKEKKVINYFMHSMSDPRTSVNPEEVFLGVQNNGDVLMHECEPCSEGLTICNPDYKPSSSRRLSTGGPVIKAKRFFPSDRQKLNIVEFTGLMSKATQERVAEAMVYDQDATPLVYGENGLLFAK